MQKGFYIVNTEFAETFYKLDQYHIAYPAFKLLEAEGEALHMWYVSEDGTKHDIRPCKKGFMLWAVEEDTYGNKISYACVHTGDSDFFNIRMNLHPKKAGHYSCFGPFKGYIAYAKTNQPESDTEATMVKAAGYCARWGDGDFLGVSYDGDASVKSEELIVELATIEEQDRDAVILEVFDHIKDKKECWILREPKLARPKNSRGSSSGGKY